MREFFINADFDLRLRRGRDPSTVDARARQADEIPMHLLFLGIEGDTVLAGEELSESFATYLERLALPVPTVCVRPDFTRDAEFCPFGWNRDATRFNQLYEVPAEHPPLEVVRRVNGRRWAASLEWECCEEEATLGVVHNLEELEALLRGRPVEESEWVVKSEHGNSGLGNRRLRGRRLEASDRELVGRLLTEDECLLVERWFRRVVDLVASFDVTKDGEVSNLLIYEAVNTADGAFIGDIFDREGLIAEEWRPRLVETSAKVARSLAAEGYFGPVCLDAFVWNDGKEDRFRALVEVNARLQVAAGVLRLWQSWSRRPVVYWRLFSSKKLRLPGGYGEFHAALGNDAFDPISREGVLLTSPLEISGRRPMRIGVLLAGEDRSALDALDRRFRDRFER